MKLKNWKQGLKRRLGMIPAKSSSQSSTPKASDAAEKLRSANEKLREANQKQRDVAEKLRANVTRSEEVRQKLRDRVAAADLNAAVMKDAMTDERDFRVAELRDAIQRLTGAVELASGLGQEADALTADLRAWLGEAQATEKRLTSEFGTNFATSDYPRVKLNFWLSENPDPANIQRRADLLNMMPTALNSTRALAILNLQEYGSFDGYVAAVKAQTHKGMALQDMRKAERAGFYCKQINMLNYVPDIFEVNHSKGERQGGGMREPYNATIEQLGGVPREAQPLVEPRDPRHHDYWWGIFEKAPGYRQADGIQTDERLVGYVLLERYGNFARYRHILGHGDHLDKGIMFLLHFSIVRWMYETMPDLRYLIYAGWTDLPQQDDSRPGLTRWKKKTLFQPAYAMEELSLPREHMLEWIRTKVGKREFPEYVLEGTSSAAAFYAAALMGVRDVIHLHDHNVKDVVLIDLDADKMAELQKVYPANWEYVVDDAYKVMDRLHDDGRAFDILILDPWTHRQRSDMERLPSLLDITNRYIVISLSANSYFRQANINPDSHESLLEHLQDLDPRVSSVQVQLCTSIDGGLYWVTIGKEQPAA